MTQLIEYVYLTSLSQWRILNFAVGKFKSYSKKIRDFKI